MGYPTGFTVKKRTLVSPVLSILSFGLILLGTMMPGPVGAEPVAADPEVNKPGPAPEPRSESTVPLQPMEVAQPPEPDHQDAFFYKYQSAAAFNMGPYFVLDSSGQPVQYWLYGFSYLWDSPRNFHFESGLEGITFGEGHFWTSAHLYFLATTRWRPFVTVGPGIRLVPSNGLATFLQLANYFVRYSGGVEYSVVDQASLRAELYAATDFQARPFFGITLGWEIGF